MATRITSIVNLSLSEQSFLLHFKTARVSTFLKQPTFYKDNMKNCWPATSFSFLSKILEKDVACRLKTQINDLKISNPFQCAYRKFHSMETSLQKIHNDILSSMDDGKVTALTLLHLFAAFDTINHSILRSMTGRLVWGYWEGT